MKVAVSLPDELFRRAEQLAERRKMARSTLYAQALQEYLERHGGDAITEQLNRVYERESSQLEPDFAAMQVKPARENWD